MKLGFIGAGNMAGALMQGVIKGSVVQAKDVHLYDVNQERLQQLNHDFGVTIHDRCADMIAACDMVVLAVKPYVAGEVIAQQRDALKGKAVISIMGSWTTDMLKGALDPSTRFLRVMPNTPALVGEGMTALCDEVTLTGEEKAFAEKMFLSCGKASWIHENLMDAETAIAGCAPAFVYMFIEALGDAGVLLGLARAQAYEMAAQAVKGSAKMVLETGMHPGALKDMVTSPAGATIVGCMTLEEKGMRGAVMDAVVASAKKAGEPTKA